MQRLDPIRFLGYWLFMNFFRFLFLTALITVFPMTVFSAEPDPPTQVVENLHASLLGVMKEAKKIGYQGRYEQLSPVIKETFDLPFIARIVVGRYWRTFNDEQKVKFLETFERLSIATYAHRFDGYSGEQFRLVSEKESRRGRIIVNTLLIKPDGEKIELDYTLKRHKHRWRVINVTANGVSDLSLKRSDYTTFLKRNGFEALINKLDEKICSYSGKESSP